MATYIYIAQLVVSIVLIFSILLQVRGGGLGGVFGSQESVYRTKRGVEKTLYQFTIILAVFFIVLAIFGVRMLARS
ncbi:MAG: preprotein translocase subunit SecG [Dehalococcoidia bacterium]|nr:preprotein translocase subunit SecG [Dehalococcoidia bacterium]MDZ4245534.1 preprotein translocase subunit SecG [Dehalococcoidia bacterium]